LGNLNSCRRRSPPLAASPVDRKPLNAPFPRPGLWCRPVCFKGSFCGKEIRYGTGFALGFSVRTDNAKWDSASHVGEYSWGGAASTHYWVSPADGLIVITLEQIMPYQWDTELGVKKIIYEALKK